jgi:hypothetical protein
MRYCATSRKAAGLISDGAMPLGWTQPLIEMNTNDLRLWVKAVGAWGWQPYIHHMLTENLESLKLLDPYGLVQACTRMALHLLYKYLPILKRRYCFAVQNVLRIIPLPLTQWAPGVFSREQNRQRLVLATHHNLVPR